MKAFWLGLGLGISWGVLVAPRSGEETRNELWPRMRGRQGPDENNSATCVLDETASARVSGGQEITRLEATQDKALADSFPTSDPPSSIPDPSGDESTNAA